MHYLTLCKICGRLLGKCHDVSKGNDGGYLDFKIDLRYKWHAHNHGVYNNHTHRSGLIIIPLNRYLS